MCLVTCPSPDGRRSTQVACASGTAARRWAACRAVVEVACWTSSRCLRQRLRQRASARERSDDAQMDGVAVRALCDVALGDAQPERQHRFRRAGGGLWRCSPTRTATGIRFASPVAKLRLPPRKRFSLIDDTWKTSSPSCRAARSNRDRCDHDGKAAIQSGYSG
jgi:hypothetical protein